MIATWPMNHHDCILLIDFNMTISHANSVTNIICDINESTRVIVFYSNCALLYADSLKKQFQY